MENYTNRSPYPMLHLLREESVTAVASWGDTMEIPPRNVGALRRLGKETMQAMLRAAAITAP